MNATLTSALIRLTICVTTILLASTTWMPIIFAQANTDPTMDEKKQAEQKAVVEARLGIAVVQAVLDNSFNVIRRMDAAKNSIGSLAAKAESTEQTLRNVSELNSVLKRLIDEGLTANIRSSGERLTSAKSALTALLTKLPADSANEDVIAARTAVNTRITEVDSQIKAVNDGKVDLSVRSVSLCEFVKSVYNKNTDRLKGLEDTAPDANEQILLLVLTERLSQATDSIHFVKILDEEWAEMAPRIFLLSGINDAEALSKKGEVEIAAKAAPTKVISIVGKLKGWFDTLNAHSTTVINSLNTVLKAAYDDPNQTVATELEIEKAGKLAGYLREIAVNWTALSVAFKKFEFQNPIDLGDIQTSADGLDAQASRLDTRKVLLMDSTSGDMSKFKTEFIQLYYFTDANNLIRALNPAAFEVRDAAGLREQAAQIRRELERAGIDLADAQSEVNNLQKRLDELLEEKRQADAQLLSATGLFTSAEKRLADLKSRPDPQDPGRVKRAEDDVAGRKADKEAAQANSDALNNQQTGLPGKIAVANDRLISAQADVRRARNNGLLLASAESEAFVAARNNEKIFIAPILGTSRDPMKRVFLYAFGDRKVIYMRGLENDVREVKAAIALFDRPAPQARLTLWTLELNSTADNSGAKKFATVLPEIENGLANTRSRIAASLSFLRDAINKKVSLVNNSKLNNATSGKTSRDLKWARSHFYEKSVLLRFGFDPDAATPDLAANEIVDMMLPDPAGVTTLGEALVVLSLASHENRRDVLNDFQARLDQELKKLGLPNSVADTELRLGCQEKYSPPQNCWFAGLRRAIGADESSNGSYDYTSQQKEIVDAIIKSSSIRVITRLEQLLKTLKSEQAKRGGAGNASTEEDNLVDRIVPILGWLYQQYGVLPQEVLRNGSISTSAYKQTVGSVDLLRTANAQVARADLMLKQLIDAVDQDIDRHFVQPMVEGLRLKLVKEKVIGVGVANRSSVLASNRLLARVDARSSAQLPLGEEQNILQSVFQLSQLSMAAQTGGLLGAFGNLNSLSQKTPQEIYGLTTNSQFKVTPIFDPTGQTLRFQFDYIAANQIQEPSGTTNPQLPRIERHTVNTEVELNNLEIREISRYNTNAKLGLPTRKWGGIPLIKDIPGMRSVPLLGWFTRKAGSAAVVQQSLMFGQTTMYPTIGDMLELLKSADYLDYASPQKTPDCREKQSDDPCANRGEFVTITLDSGLQQSFDKNKAFILLKAKIN